MEIIIKNDRNIIEMAKQLGHNLIFIKYDLTNIASKEDFNTFFELISKSLLNDIIIEIKPNYIINFKTKLKEYLKNNNFKFNIKFLYDAEKQELLKNYKFILKHYDFVYNLEKIEHFDYFNQARSGLNEVISKDFKKYQIEIIIKFDNILKTSKNVILRINQNVNLCKKFNININCCSFAKSKYEILNKKDITLFENILKN